MLARLVLSSPPQVICSPRPPKSWDFSIFHELFVDSCPKPDDDDDDLTVTTKIEFHCHPGWSAVVGSWLTEVSTSWAQGLTLLPVLKCSSAISAHCSLDLPG
ncbi:hypothetical protein AAY473_024038 [Plecturocebus cupreus]